MNRRGFLQLLASVPLLGSALKVGEAPAAISPPSAPPVVPIPPLPPTLMSGTTMRAFPYLPLTLQQQKELGWG